MDIEGFIRDGFTVVRGAFDAATAAECRDAIWSRLAEPGVLRDDRSTWREPLVSLECPSGPAFARAAGMAQPGVEVPDGFRLDGSDTSPVAQAIMAGIF
jgi:hypothetical protein